jgi:hypothetical protein
MTTLDSKVSVNRANNNNSKLTTGTEQYSESSTGQ